MISLSCLTATVLYCMLNLHRCKNVSLVGNNTVEILYTIPVPGSRSLFIASPTCVSFFFFSDSRLLMCYFYSVNLLPPSPFGCQAMGQGTWLAKDVLLDTLTVILSCLMNLVLSNYRQRADSFLYFFLKNVPVNQSSQNVLQNIMAVNSVFTQSYDLYLPLSSD